MNSSSLFEEHFYPPGKGMYKYEQLLLSSHVRPDEVSLPRVFPGVGLSFGPFPGKGLSVFDSLAHKPGIWLHVRLCSLGITRLDLSNSESFVAPR